MNSSQATPSAVHESAQAEVQKLIDKLVARRQETGLQVAAYLNGKKVIDAWSGIANTATGAPVDAQTLFLTFSCSKGVTSTLIHQLVEAGILDYEAPIASYWPEFAAQGKENITLRQILTHEAGIPHLPLNLSMETLCDAAAMRDLVAQLRPRWQPGLRTAYHAITMGTILCEVVEKATGQSFREAISERIARPLGLTDFDYGIPPFKTTRLARFCGTAAPWSRWPRVFLIHRAIPGAVEPGVRWNCPEVNKVPMPGGNLVTNASSLAKHYAALCPAGVEGVHLLPPERLRLATTLQTRARDYTMLWLRVPKALGYWLGSGAVHAMGPRASVFGHTGAGGSIAFADPELNFSLAILKNQMSYRGPEDTDVKVMQTVRKALGLKD